MTLVHDAGRDGPRVHALVIGVGSYRHLPGGSEPVTHDTLGLRQLTGPPLSARMFADWVVTRMRHPRVPLGTVELLTSPGEPPAAADPAEPAGQPAAATVELPTQANVTAAFERWFATCSSDEGNVALFYFCGHGVERESPFLLLEDFGRSELALLENAVDIGQTYQGMARCRAREQYLFVDACREIPFQLLQLLSGNARVPITPQLVGDPRRDSALVLATSGGAKAYGRPGRPTRFTQALVRALDGLGAQWDGGRWVVDVPTLQRALTLQLRSDDDGAPAQLPSVRGAGIGVLHALPRAPLVPITLACLPPDAVAAAAVSLTGMSAFSAAPPGDPPQLVASTTGWSVEVPADFYTLTIDFPTGAYRRAEEKVAALPPGVYGQSVQVTA